VLLNSHTAALPALPRYRFGTFELDARSGELRRNGAKLRLQDQPFLVLRKLLESAGGVVAREDLHAALWPADTFVDFDTSLNSAIKRLREVLGDSADTPVFIETVPRRGYRFLAPVQVIANGRLAPVQYAADPGATPFARPSSRLFARAFASNRAGLLVAFLVVALVAAGLLLFVRSPVAVPRVLDATQITFDERGKGNLYLRDGKIYFNEQASDRVTLLEIPYAGGIPVVLDSSYPGLFLRGVSSDGSKLLVVPAYGKKGPFPLKIMDLASGSLQSVDGIECDNVSWAPGGKIIFSRDQDVFLSDADGSNQHKLLSASGPVSHMVFSPDGARLRFSVGDRKIDQITIWEAQARGTGLHQILTEMTDFPDRCCGEWSPDGRYYFFETRRNGQNRIWALPERHSWWSRTPTPVALTTVPPNFYMGKLSESGKKLFVTAADPRAELVRYDSSSRQFVPFLSGISAGDVEASRDGHMLTYVRYPEETLWRSNADGSEAAQLTGPSLRSTLAHWSPDGSRIAFSGSRPGRPWNIFVIPAGGGPAEQLTSGTVSDLDPTWSPDGATIAYGQTRMEGGKPKVSIQLLDLASRRSSTVAGSDGICCPRWSPDGRYLLTSHADYDDLLLYEFATGKWTAIAKGLGAVGYMEWVDGGKTIVFDTLLVPEPAFYRLRLADLHLETIAKIGDIRRYYGSFGPWTGIAPDGSLLLDRDVNNEEIYSLDLQLP
jgi:Tol biopolymer transport system component/DNA-binding winged helix-turn-helix (wHTH) protein